MTAAVRATECLRPFVWYGFGETGDLPRSFKKTIEAAGEIPPAIKSKIDSTSELVAKAKAYRDCVQHNFSPALAGGAFLIRPGRRTTAKQWYVEASDASPRMLKSAVQESRSDGRSSSDGFLLEDEPRIERDTMAPQELQIFVLERLTLMMFTLILDVVANRRSLRFADRKCAVSPLP